MHASFQLLTEQLENPRDSANPHYDLLWFVINQAVGTVVGQGEIYCYHTAAREAWNLYNKDVRGVVSLYQWKQTSCWHVALQWWMCPAILPRFYAAFSCSKVKHWRFCFGCSLSQLQHTAEVPKVMPSNMSSIVMLRTQDCSADSRNLVCMGLCRLLHHWDMWGPESVLAASQHYPRLQKISKRVPTCVWSYSPSSVYGKQLKIS